jgi:NADP-dependent 3-hydroxy acid dehydrogenase YdfG
MKRFEDSVVLVTGTASRTEHAAMRRLYNEGSRIGAAGLKLARLGKLMHTFPDVDCLKTFSINVATEAWTFVEGTKVLFGKITHVFNAGIKDVGITASMAVGLAPCGISSH